MSVGSIEKKFYALLLEKLGLDANAARLCVGPGPVAHHARNLCRTFREKTRDEWCTIMEGTDICFAPVLGFGEAARTLTPRLAGVSWKWTVLCSQHRRPSSVDTRECRRAAARNRCADSARHGSGLFESGSRCFGCRASGWRNDRTTALEKMMPVLFCKVKCT